MITIDYKDKIVLREQKEEEEKREIVNFLKKMAYEDLDLNKNCYISSNTYFTFSCKRDFPNYDPEKIRLICRELRDTDFFSRYSFQNADYHPYDEDIMSISDYGVIEYESYLNPSESKNLSEELMRLLYSIKKVENDEKNKNIDISSEDIIKEMKNNGTHLNDLEITYLGRVIIEHLCEIRVDGKSWVIMSLGQGKSNISPFGVEIMRIIYQNEKKFTRDFLSSSRIELINRYNKINEEISNKDYKSAMIWMGSILEVCIKKWGIYHGPKFNWKSNRNINFERSGTNWHDMMVFAYEYGCDKFGDIGNGYDWGIVDAIFREARNSIHIDVSTKLNLEERHYRSFKPIFDYLIAFF